ncbi:glycosyltransferase [Rivularia sp. UHCC 0363]|uniref:glycosyltransferase n=1 Tax=Rivularia sp. UHCC 0363 TaxID=3110244 RepID=UPI002B20CB00|nr:glycosyltransferase [Rivularia sp. UHCC 0363]MEA5596119.1 glycosyltransferase [Rivularia sp. UHCC 0363]
MLAKELKPNIKQPHICQVVTSINEHTGGTAYAVTNLAESLTKQQIYSHLFTLNYQQRGKQLLAEGVKLHSHTATTLTKYFRGFQPIASQAMQQLASLELDLIHNHGLWMFPNLYARQAAVKNELPLIISPEGMLESWSLKNNWYKKALPWFLYERKNLNSAIAFHATSTEEAQSIRKLGFKQPIALIPNGVNIPSFEEQPSKEILIQTFPELADKKWLLFLSRIHPKKGMDNLLNVWHSLTTKFSDWHLIIAGPDLTGYQSKLEALVEKLNLKHYVTFTGMLSGEYKASALSNADLFVLPTHSENFGIVIAESLAYGVPVITTRGTPWKDLQLHKCGWWIDDNQQSLHIALNEAMNMSSEERQGMGLRGRNLVETKYSWNFVARDMANVYRWILGGTEPPSCLQFNDSLVAYTNNTGRNRNK